MISLLGRSRGTLVGLACVGAGLSGAVVAPSAFAGAENYGGGPPNPRFYSGYESFVGPRHSMNSNNVANYYGVQGNRVCAGARDGSTYAFVGEFFCGGGRRCHPYDGTLRYPVAHNGEGFGQTMFGTTYYGADSYPGVCA